MIHIDNAADWAVSNIVVYGGKVIT